MVWGKTMARKILQFYLRKYLAASRKSQTAGFTLLELLMAIAVAGIVLYGMLSLVVSLLGIEQKETAKSQVQQEMDRALDYIAADVQKAVYIYEGECLTAARGSAGDEEYCPGLDNVLKFSTSNVIPILAFWKLEELPYREGATGTEALPTSCSPAPAGTTQEDCFTVLTSRHASTLVVYGLKTQPSATWEGPATITRYQLRKYKSDELSTLTKTQNYVDPRTTGKNYQTWPCDTTGANCQAQQAYAESGANKNADVLVDLVDTGLIGTNAPSCADSDYSRAANAAHSSFYACVKPPKLASGNFQDAIIFLRGNAAKKAGQSGSRNPVYLPSLQRRVQARSLYETTPSDL